MPLDVDLDQVATKSISEEVVQSDNGDAVGRMGVGYHAASPEVLSRNDEAHGSVLVGSPDFEGPNDPIALERSEAVHESASSQEAGQMLLRLESVYGPRGTNAFRYEQGKDPDIRAEIDEDGIGPNEAEKNVEILGFVLTAIQDRARDAGVAGIEEYGRLIGEVGQGLAGGQGRRDAAANELSFVAGRVQFFNNLLK